MKYRKIGWVTCGVMAVITVAIALFSWYWNAESKEFKKVAEYLEDKYSIGFTVVGSSDTKDWFQCKDENGLVGNEEAITVKKTDTGYGDNYALYFVRERFNSWMHDLFCEQFADVKAFLKISNDCLPDGLRRDCELDEFFKVYPDYCIESNVFVIISDNESDETFQKKVNEIERVLYKMERTFNISVYGVSQDSFDKVDSSTMEVAQKMAKFKGTVKQE